MKENIPFKTLIILLPYLVYFLFLSCKATGQTSVKELQDHIKYLASDSLKGRLTGTPGDSLSAEYIRSKLLSFGLQPLYGDGYQRFRVLKKVLPGKENYLTIDGINYKPETDFIPMSFSSNTDLDAEIVFCGYGFNFSRDSLKWNDYKGIDVKGKWVILLRGDPESGASGNRFSPFSSDRDKSLMAKDMGAMGVLLISGPLPDYKDVFEQPGSEGYSVGIPVFSIRKQVAEIILAKSKNTLEDLEKTLINTRKPFSFATGIKARGQAEIVRVLENTRNIVMSLAGEDSILKNEYLIIGAHFDHLGKGGQGSGSRAPDTTAIHHGADDNASGVAMLIEIAKIFSLTKGSHKRSIICLAFSGEEKGLLGSKYYTDNPCLDLTKVNAMINLDMVGRLNESNNLQISGIGTASGLKDLVYSVCDTSEIKLTLSDEGYGPSDHSSFYIKNLPVLFFFTGAHTDYHTPSDTYDKINYMGMVKISRLIFNVAEELASVTPRLQFKEAGPRVQQVRNSRQNGVTLGIMPDFAGIVKNGLRADFVTPDKPAALGGMMKGDIITFINGKSVNNIQDYMFRMAQLKHGETISVEVLRDGKKVVLLIQL